MSRLQRRDVHSMDVMQNRRMGGVDPKLIIALVVCALGAGIFWWWSSRPDPELDLAFDPNATYTLVCTQCKKVSTVTGKTAAGMSLKGGYRACPECKAYAAQFGKADDVKEKPKTDKPAPIMP